VKASRTILLVEDDPDVREMMVDHLQVVGYRVIEASDGMEGLRRLKTDQYDLVITDIVMPFVSGAGVVLTAKTRHPEVPVIAITGQGKVSQALAAECKSDLVLEKPMNMNHLLENIRRLLGEPS
jgi:DNA-binding response OmpR family regulator